MSCCNWETDFDGTSRGTILGHIYSETLRISRV